MPSTTAWMALSIRAMIPAGGVGLDFGFRAAFRGLGFAPALSLVLEPTLDLALTVVRGFARFVLDLEAAFLRAFLAISASQAALASRNSILGAETELCI
jgi:hypothetical protein